MLYRVTSIFERNNLVANGILMEEKSVENNEKGILFNVFICNVQPGIDIDYKIGKSSLTNISSKNNSTTYVLNTNVLRYNRFLPKLKIQIKRENFNFSMILLLSNT